MTKKKKKKKGQLAWKLVLAKIDFKLSRDPGTVIRSLLRHFMERHHRLILAVFHRQGASAGADLHIKS